ncbi:MAG: hypothetical protein NT121_24110 [Chloroflexi bacterium]|nr:hypothetical protein [Chloroflexota bacterium]
MRPTLFIGFLIVTLLTAASPAPHPIINDTAPAQQPAAIKLPTLIGSDLMSAFNTQASPGCLAPKGLHGDTAPFKVENIGTKKANVNINGTSKNGNYVVYCSFVVKQGIPVTIELMFGKYVYLVARGTKTSRGSFSVNNSDKATMQVFKDKIRIGPFP